MQFVESVGKKAAPIILVGAIFSGVAVDLVEARNPVAPVRNTDGTNYLFKGSPEVLSKITPGFIEKVVKNSESNRAKKMKEARGTSSSASGLCSIGLSCSQKSGFNQRGYELITKKALESAIRKDFRAKVKVKVWEKQKNLLACPNSTNKLAARTDAKPNTKTIPEYVGSINALVCINGRYVQ